MTNRVLGIFSALVLAGASLGTLVPTGSAEAESQRRDWRGDRDGYSRGDGYGQDDGYGRSDRYRRGSERTYYYKDPFCGRRSSHISDFKGHYHRSGHKPLILKVDIRSGQVLATYRYDHDEQEWRDWDRRYRSDHDEVRTYRSGRQRSRDRDHD